MKFSANLEENQLISQIENINQNHPVWIYSNYKINAVFSNSSFIKITQPVFYSLHFLNLQK